MKTFNLHCPMCEKKHALTITDEQASALFAYHQRAGLIQDLLPDLEPWKREALKSGYCKECQDMLFNPASIFEENGDEEEE